MPRRAPGAGHHDEPEPRGSARSIAGGERLQGQSQSRTGNPAPARKIDHLLLRRQYNRLFEIQQIQIELLEELARKREG